MIETVSALGIGFGTSTLFQLSKGDWNPWLNKLMALVSGFGAGYVQGGVEGGLVAASATLAAHGAFFADTALGKALKVSIVPRVLRVVSEIATNLADAIENKTP